MKQPKNKIDAIAEKYTDLSARAKEVAQAKESLTASIKEMAEAKGALIGKDQVVRGAVFEVGYSNVDQTTVDVEGFRSHVSALHWGKLFKETVTHEINYDVLERLVRKKIIKRSDYLKFVKENPPIRRVIVRKIKEEQGEA